MEPVGAAAEEPLNLHKRWRGFQRSRVLAEEQPVYPPNKTWLPQD